VNGTRPVQRGHLIKAVEDRESPQPTHQDARGAPAIIDESPPRLIPGTELHLVAEVISPGSGSERTDRLRKVTEYARLGIPQYWIVEHSPRLTVQVLTLADGTYTAAPAVAEGTVLEAVTDADKPITVSFEQHYNATARPFGWKFTRAPTSTSSWPASAATTRSRLSR
jgi:Putative restriction endonuclease